MVEPVDVETVESKPGEIVAGDVQILYRIVSVKVARVAKGYHVAAATDVFARPLTRGGATSGVCTPGVPYRPVPFEVRDVATAVVRVEGLEIEVYVEPVSVAVAEGHVTPLGEPCIALHTVTGWTVRSR